MSCSARTVRAASVLATLVIAMSTASSDAFAANKAKLEDIGDDTPSSGGAFSRGVFGLGLVLGVPTGLTAKVLFARYNGIQLHVGYGLGTRGRFVLITDYLFHFVDVVPPLGRAGRLAPYVGVGGRFSIRENDDVLLGVRIPLGASFMVNGAPIEVFVELALGVGIVPSTVAIFDGGLGGRFYF